MLFQIMRYTGCTVLYSIFIWHVLRPAIKSGVFSSYSTSGDFFVLRPLCYLEERLAAGCMAPSMSDTARDISQCAITCLSDGSCVGCSRAQPDGKLYQHWPCDRVFPVCQDGNAEMQYLQRNSPCQNGGQWDESVERCSCSGTGGFAGEFCQRKAESCAELGASGYPGGYNNHTFAFPGYTAFYAFCYLTGPWNIEPGNWKPTGTLFLFQNPIDYVFHNKTWAQYENGFWERGGLNTSPIGWIGLANMVKILHYMKPDSVFMKFQMGNSMYVQTYFGFDLTEGTYTLSYSSVSATRQYGNQPTKMAEPCFLESTIGAKFSTWDRDNDDNPTMNCAAEAGGGWWYRFCNESCNLFLPTYDPVTPEPVSYTKVRLGNIDPRNWAETFGRARLCILQTLD